MNATARQQLEVLWPDFEACLTRRKLRLTACACCRRIWDLLEDDRSQRAVETAEDFADGLVPLHELASVERAAWEAAKIAARHASAPKARAAWAAWAAAKHPAWALTGAIEAEVAAVVAAVGQPALAVAQKAQAHILLDVLGLGCDRTLPPHTTRWNDACVVKIASSSYYGRTYDRLPILADALEDAGCDNTDILNHCRSGSHHVRGCWVVDLLLGKE